MNERTRPATPPAHVLAAYGLQQPAIEQITSGHINLTWRLRQDERDDVPTDLILQRVNPVFDPSVQNDIYAVTSHLRDVGIPTIQMIATLEGAAFLDTDDEVWRLTRFIEGETRERMENMQQAREAGRVLGAFHRGMRSYSGGLSHSRMNVHDFSLHLQRLDMALLRFTDHRSHAQVATLAAHIVETAAEIRDFPPTRNVFVHGDPKISNIIFDNDAAVCLIDLDTLTTMPIELEIADALRSWCNVEAEDSPNARFSREVFVAACEGYGGIDREIADILPDATAKIAVELAARFCTDALEERYFGWDDSRFETSSDHNQQRCQAQLTLAADILRQRSELHTAALTYAA
jgi:Ser/Thr protein kinase RdoA (MazF antagonist)